MKTNEFVKLVKNYADNDIMEESLLDHFVSMKKYDKLAQSTVRYLCHLRKWKYIMYPKLEKVMETQFGYKTELPSDYIDYTRNMILELWNYNIPDPEKQVEIPKKEKVKKPRKKKELPVEIFVAPKKDLSNIDNKDLKGASDRMKEIIKIQRGD